MTFNYKMNQLIKLENIYYWFWCLTHSLISLIQIISNLLTQFMSRNSSKIVSLSNLNKIPKHIAIAINEELVNYKDLVNITKWCQRLNVSYLSIYKNDGLSQFFLSIFFFFFWIILLWNYFCKNIFIQLFFSIYLFCFALKSLLLMFNLKSIFNCFSLFKGLIESHNEFEKHFKSRADVKESLIESKPHRNGYNNTITNGYYYYYFIFIIILFFY
jgi:hypothetical protein